MLEHAKLTLEQGQQNHQRISHDPNPYVNQADFGLLGEKKFIIDAAWWRQWCDYVNFTPESDTPLIREDISFKEALDPDTSDAEEYDVAGGLEKNAFNTNGLPR